MRGSGPVDSASIITSSPDPNSLRPTVKVLLEKEILKDPAVTVSYLDRVCTTGGTVVVFAVGAVYDRATFASGWAKCAVIDRAYSGKWVANFMLCKAYLGLGG